MLLEHFAGQLFDATVVEGVEQQLRVMSGAQQAVEQILGDGRAGHAGQGLGGHTFTDDLTLEEVQGLLDLLGSRRVQGLDGQVVAYDLFCPGSGRLAEGVVAHQVEGLDSELEQVVVAEDLGLLDDRLFHLVEGVDVSDLPVHSFLASEPHAEKGEAVASHAHVWLWPVVRSRAGTLLKIEECKILGTFQVFDIP